MKKNIMPLWKKYYPSPGFKCQVITLVAFICYVTGNKLIFHVICSVNFFKRKNILAIKRNKFQLPNYQSKIYVYKNTG